MGALGPTVTLTFVGDSDRLSRTMAKVGAEAKLLDSSFKSSGTRIIESLGNAGESFLKFGAKVTMAGASLGGSVQAIGGITAALVQASGAALVLPGVLAGVGLAMATLKIATSGFSKAMSAMNDDKAFGKAIDKLTPSAKHAAEAIKNIHDKLKGHLQETFFAGLGTEIEKVGKVYVPALNKSMGSVAISMNQMAKAVGQTLIAPHNVENIKSLLSDLTASLGKMHYTLGYLIRGFIDLGTAGGSFLPKMADAINKGAWAFAKWADTARKSGDIARWIRGGVDALRQFWQIGKNVVSIILGIWDASHTGSQDFLTRIVDLTSKFNAFIHSADGQKTLHELFATLADMGTKVGLAFKALAPDLPAVARGIKAIAESSSGTLVSTIQILAPLIPPIADALVKMGPALGPVALGLAAGGKALKLWSGVKDIFNVAKGIKDVVLGVKSWTIAQAALNFVMAISPIGWIVIGIGVLVAAIVLLWNHSKNFREFWEGAWKRIKDVAASVWTWFKNTWPLLLAILTGPIGIAVYEIHKHWDAIQNGAAALVHKIGSVFANVVGAITEPFRAAFNGIRSLWNNTIGRISFHLPDWIPGIGGKGFSMPKFHQGGVVPGSPGQEVMAILQAGETVTPAGRASSSSQVVISFGGNTDSAFASAFMKMVRTGQIQIQAA